MLTLGDIHDVKFHRLDDIRVLISFYPIHTCSRKFVQVVQAINFMQASCTSAVQDSPEHDVVVSSLGLIWLTYKLY